MRLSGELNGMVSSTRVTSWLTITTMSGWAVVTSNSLGMVEGGFSSALSPGRSARIRASGI